MIFRINFSNLKFEYSFQELSFLLTLNGFNSYFKAIYTEISLKPFIFVNVFFIFQEKG